MARLLDRLQAANMNDRGIQTWAQRVCEQIEAQFGAVAIAQAAQADAIAALAAAAAADAKADDAVADAAAAQSTANTAQSTANTANSTANTANTNANAAKKNDAASGSWTSPGAVLSASDAGSNATITIAAHTRYWGDGHSTSCGGGSITGRSYNTDYYIYYTDTNQNDTTPGYTSTTNANTAAYNSASGRVYVGKIRTPASGGGSTSGGTTPPGGGWSGPGDIP